MFCLFIDNMALSCVIVKGMGECCFCIVLVLVSFLGMFVFVYLVLNTRVLPAYHYLSFDLFYLKSSSLRVLFACFLVFNIRPEIKETMYGAGL